MGAGGRAECSGDRQIGALQLLEARHVLRDLPTMGLRQLLADTQGHRAELQMAKPHDVADYTHQDLRRRPAALFHHVELGCGLQRELREVALQGFRGVSDLPTKFSRHRSRGASLGQGASHLRRLLGDGRRSLGRCPRGLGGRALPRLLCIGDDLPGDPVSLLVGQAVERRLLVAEHPQPCRRLRLLPLPGLRQLVRPAGHRLDRRRCLDSCGRLSDGNPRLWSRLRLWSDLNGLDFRRGNGLRGCRRSRLNGHARRRRFLDLHPAPAVRPLDLRPEFGHWNRRRLRGSHIGLALVRRMVGGQGLAAGQLITKDLRQLVLGVARPDRSAFVDPLATDARQIVRCTLEKIDRGIMQLLLALDLADKLQRLRKLLGFQGLVFCIGFSSCNILILTSLIVDPRLIGGGIRECDARRWSWLDRDIGGRRLGLHPHPLLLRRPCLCSSRRLIGGLADDRRDDRRSANSGVAEGADVLGLGHPTLLDLLVELAKHVVYWDHAALGVRQLFGPGVAHPQQILPHLLELTQPLLDLRDPRLTLGEAVDRLNVRGSGGNAHRSAHAKGHYPGGADAIE